MIKRNFWIQVKLTASGEKELFFITDKLIEGFANQWNFVDNQYHIHFGSDVVSMLDDLDMFYVGLMIGQLIEQEKLESF